ncbi:F-box domain-containing protein [Heracleum sosnowskyi]|uniref:F-box domain-containing protein n=1 Tax=Heracleum sosnowskyi TaxID=360622 RepID=A0AAD8HV92_9APIA|nr:F-box domain-containing protein [Heracleum sosnowskyi]
MGQSFSYILNCGTHPAKPRSLPTSKYIPIEIVAQILLFLPVKSLIQLTPICKSWYNLIKDSQFIAAHLNHSIYMAKNNLNSIDDHGYLLAIPFKFKPGDKYFCSVICPDKMNVIEKLELPICTRNMNVEMVNSCNGLLCLTECYPNAFGHVVYLWNISIRKFKTLGNSELVLRNSSIVFKRVTGFGYDYTTDDYKVVRILYFKEDVAPEVEVYSVKIGSWRRVGVNVDFIAHCNSAAVPFVNGALHWMAQPYRLGKLGKYMFPVKDFIVAFDIVDEVFRKMALPLNCSRLDACLMDFKGLLSLYVADRTVDDIFEGCYIWAMSEYGVAKSWSKLFTVNVLAPITVRPLGLTKNQKLVFVKDEEQLVSLDVQNLQAQDLELDACLYAVDFSYTESLALLDQGI